MINITERVLKIIGVSIALLTMSACILNNTTYKDADKNADISRQKIHNAEAQFDKTDPPVINQSGFYVSTQPVKLKTGPAWLNRPIDLEAQQMPLDQLVNQLLANTNINARYDETVASQRPISMHYHGTIKGALDTLAEKTHIYYFIDEHTINWSIFETRTFNIAFMPGTSNYFVGQQANENGISGGGGSGGGPQSYDQSDVHSNLNDDQYSNLQGALSVWDDLRQALNELKSSEGTVVVSEASTSVTVRDRPDNVAAISQYIKKLNIMLSQQVAIKVEVIDVTLNKDYNLGIDWDVIANTLGTRFNLRAPLASATDVSAQTAIPNSSSTALSSFIIGKGDAKTLISALDEQGKLNVVTRPQVVTLNNQIASIRITTDTAYVKQVSTTVINDGGTTSSIEPGTVTEGFTLFVLPKIKDEDVYMQISSVLSDLLAIKKEDNEPTNFEVNQSKNNNDKNNNNSNNQFVAIQVPTLAQKVFNQRSVVRSGTTLVIAGFKRLRDATDRATLFGVPSGQGAETQNVETVVLITPVILSS